MKEYIKKWGIHALLVIAIFQSCISSRKISNLETELAQVKASTSQTSELTISKIDSVIKNAEYLQLIAERDLDEKAISLTQIKENWKNTNK